MFGNTEYNNTGALERARRLKTDWSLAMDDVQRARRRAPKTQTERMENVIACRRHLRDLREAHGQAPPDVAIATTSVPMRIAAEPTSSYCTSPAALCAELVR